MDECRTKALVVKSKQKSNKTSHRLSFSAAIAVECLNSPNLPVVAHTLELQAQEHARGSSGPEPPGCAEALTGLWSRKEVPLPSCTLKLKVLSLEETTSRRRPEKLPQFLSCCWPEEPPPRTLFSTRKRRINRPSRWSVNSLSRKASGNCSYFAALFTRPSIGWIKCKLITYLRVIMRRNNS